MAGTSIGALSVNLALESAQFIAGMKNAAAQTSAAAKSITSAMSLVKGAAAGFASALTIDAISGAIHNAFDYADAIQDLSDRTGASTKMIQEFRYAAQLSGSSVESADAGLEKFAKTMGQAQNGSDQADKMLRKFGVTSNDVDVGIRQAAEGISKLKTQSEKAAATADLFGKKNQNLTVTMASGAAGLSEMAQKANELGIVMDSGLIANAGKVNDQLDTLKMIVTAEMAGSIIKNADAINSIAVSLTNVIVALANFWSKSPEKAMAILGAMGGASAGAMVGGPLGAAIGGTAGAIGGYILGSKVHNDTYMRNAKYAAADKLSKDAAAQASAFAHQGASNATVQKFFNIQSRAERTKARIAKGIDAGTITVGSIDGSASGYGAHSYATGGGHLPPPKPDRGKKGPSAEELAKREAARLEAYYKELSSAQKGELQAQYENNTSIAGKAALSRQMLDMEHTEAQRDIDLQVKEGKLKEDEAAKLRKVIDARYNSELKSINNQETDDLAKAQADLMRADLDSQLEINQGQQELAQSMKERRKLALESIDLQFQQQRAELESVIASKTASDADKALAQAKLARLPQAQAMAADVAKQQTAGPLEAYLTAIPHTADAINEQLEQVQVDGLEKLQDGLAGVIEGTKSVADAFKDMASSIIDGLLKIALQQAIIKPLGNLLFGDSGSSGGGLGGLFGSIFKGALSGARANGGMTQTGDYLVGERGPELVRIGAPANVIPNSGLKASNDNSGTSVVIHSITSNDPAMVRAMVMQGVAAALPVTNKQATDNTYKRLNRRTL